MTPRWMRSASTLAVIAGLVACGDDAFGPTLTDQWGGTGAVLDATESPPALQLACGTTAQFQGPIPLTAAGTFTVQADWHQANASGISPLTISGRLTGINLLLTVEFPGAPPGTPNQEFILYRGRNDDFPEICALAADAAPTQAQRVRGRAQV